MMDGRDGLNFLPLSLLFGPHFNSTGILGQSSIIILAFKMLISCSKLEKVALVATATHHYCLKEKKYKQKSF